MKVKFWLKEQLKLSKCFLILRKAKNSAKLSNRVMLLFTLTNFDLSKSVNSRSR